MQCTASPEAPAQAGQGPAARQPYTTHSWRWQGHKINYAVAGCGKPVLMVHGFGASVGHWKRNIPALTAAGYKVWAVDLLGQGGSDKPILDYTIDLWVDLVRDFIAEFVAAQPVVLVGNSVGSLVVLTVNAREPADTIAGTVLVNCAGGLNNKAIVQDWRIRLALPLFYLIDFLLSQPRIARYLFDRFRTKENLRTILKGLYVNQLAVDDDLIDMLHDPSADVGALEAFVSIITGPPGTPPEQLMPSVKGPLLVVWGSKDVFTPIDGPVGKYFRALPSSRPDTEFHELPGENHCVHDDNPELVNSIVTAWLGRRA